MQYASAFLHFAETALKESVSLRNLRVVIHRDRFPDRDCCWPRVLLTEVSSLDTPGGCGHPVSGEVLIQAALELDICDAGWEPKQKMILDAIDAALIGVHSHDYFGQVFSIAVRRSGQNRSITTTLSSRQIRRTTPLYRGFIQ